MTDTDRTAVVLTSGGDAVTPFTSPETWARSGLAAGNTCTALREHLLAAGHAVYTSPAMAGRGPVTDQPEPLGFGDCDVVLPDVLTVNAVGDIDLAGERLNRFWTYLHDQYAVDTIDIVAHSMGGLYSRAALRVAQRAGSPVTVRSLTTLGTPWQGAFLADYAAGSIPLADCNGDPTCERAMELFQQAVAAHPVGSGQQVTRGYLMGAEGWNEFQAGVLDGIPLTLIAGDYFAQPGLPHVWPNDGIVARDSALALEVGTSVLPEHVSHTFPVTHSLFVSRAIDAPDETGMTWNPDVFAAVDDALARAAGN